MSSIDEIMAAKAAKYKKKVAGAFVLVEGGSIADKVTGSDFVATKKLDGSMQLVFVDGDDIRSVSRNGAVLGDFPCLKEFKDAVKKAGLHSAVFAAELWVRHSDGHRERVYDVKACLDGEPPQPDDALCLAPFDILETDGADYEYIHYRELLKDLDLIFGGGQLVRPVEAKEASSKSGLEDIYREWVVEQGAEGIVVHSESPIVYKIKQQHTFDAAVLGYTTTDNDPQQVRDLLLGMLLPDGTWQIVGASGGGLTVQQRKDYYAALANDGVLSEYIYTDSRGVAHRMVEPKLVVEISVLDLVTENSVGEPKMNVLLAYDSERGFLMRGTTAGVAMISPIIQGLREDKKPDTTDVRISQLTDLVEFSQGYSKPIEKLPASEILARRVYTKGAGAKLMVHKFIVFKTNKEQSGIFPAYVLHHTDYSCGRKEPLKSDLRVSSSREQIFALLDEFIAENIKKGWAEV